MNENELIKWCEQNLTSKNKKINPNWTRNNFEYLKKRWPNIWKELKDKNIYVNGKNYKFEEINYDPLIINGKIYTKCNRNRSGENIKNIKSFINKNKNHTMDELLKFMIENNHTKSFSLLNLIKKCYPKEYKKIMDNYSEFSNSHNEIIYRYLNDIRYKPKINGYELKFKTYSSGYLSYDLYLKLSNINIKDDIQVLKMIYNGDTGCNGITDLKRFFPEIIKRAKGKSKVKNISESIYLYMNEMDKPPKCLYCKSKKSNWSGSFAEGYHIFCSKDCKNNFISIKKLNENNIDISIWKQYHRRVWNYTKKSYKEYENEINPEKLLRGRDFHLDHMISIAYGFANQIDPKIIGHKINLQIIPAKENLKKGGKSINTNAILEKVNEFGLDYYE